MNIHKAFAAATLTLFAAACGGADAAPHQAGAQATSAGAAAAVPATGNVIEVKMVTDHNGNYFEPAEIQARQGDVLRFVLASGVHNANFATANVGMSAVPDATPMLQISGRAADVVINVPPGEYAFQCDPHAMLGMVGKLTVQ